MSEGPFEVLLQVQDLDTQISQLQHRKGSLAERAELDAVESRLAALDARLADARARRAALLEREADLERQIRSVTDRRQAIEQRMYADRGSAARDLQAMNDEVRHLEARRSEFEDAELELMVEQEPVDAELAQLAAERGGAADVAATLRASVEAAEAVVDAELRTAEASRAEAATRLDPELGQRYETLRARLKGTGAARLIGNHCDGCHLELPSVEVERIRHLPPDEVVTCDQCGRILVRAAGGA